jgi:ADP-dependent NAD(P)H-hydrate dehydratase / NAD(P)H-hydrate epimerase
MVNAPTHEEIKMKLVTVSEMREIEKEADVNGLTYAQMMENAGRGLAEVVRELSDEIEAFFVGKDGRDVLGLVGAGNNGGDTLVALASLAADDCRVHAYVLARSASNDALLKQLHAAGGEIVLAESDPDFEKLTEFVGAADVILDGVLGTGLKLPLKPEIAKVLNAVNTAIVERNSPPEVVAVDCPSGVDCETGEAAPEVIPASVTVCMGAVKRGLLALPAFELVGDLRVVEIGLTDEPRWQAITRFVPDAEMVAEMLPARPADAHKGTFGTALIAAGSLNYPGAAMLAGKAAYLAGAGLVQMAVPAPVQSMTAGNFPEAIWALLPHEMGAIAPGAADVLAKSFERATALLLGPGLGDEEPTAKFVENLLKGKPAVKKAASMGFVHKGDEKKDDAPISIPPMVVDADGLRLLAKIEKWNELLPALSVLTPHPGEMAALTGLEKDEIQKDRIGIARKYAARWGHVVVLKGAFTVIAAPDGRVCVIPVASAALARAGSGDVLAGVIVGLRAQGVEAFDAAVAGAWIHAQAGLTAYEENNSAASVLAGDILNAVPSVIGRLGRTFFQY